MNELRVDLAVYGATPGGIAAAIMASRGGLSVALVERSAHIGGFLSSGLGVMDTMYDGHRAEFYDEFCRLVLDHYRTEYGEDSQQFRDAAPNVEWPLRVEPKVAELLLIRLVAQTNIVLRTGAAASSVERDGRLLTAMLAGGERIVAETFIDGTYEGDLAALGGAPYRIGRESRSEFGEPHAGRIFTRQVVSADGLPGWPREATEGPLNLRGFKSITQEIFAGSTGEGDDLVQAYSFRVTLCNDPRNRRMPEMPEDYDPATYRAIDTGKPIGPPNLPNGKRFWFRNLTGGSNRYPDANETEREVIRAEHRAFALGYLWFLQNDETVPAEVQAEARDYGLALDEYTDNDNFPYEFYVREARRIVGDHAFSEHDASIAPGLRRTPVHGDAIAIAEWFMDSHEVSDEVVFGSSQDGKILLTELTRPSQIPYRVLFANGIDNLVVPVCMSSTHVGWGTLRLEPVWMHTGEVAGRAAVIAHRDKIAARLIEVTVLQRQLVCAGGALSFFNDVDVADPEPWVPAVQYMSAFGLFGSYDARPAEPLTEGTAIAWLAACAEIAGNPHADRSAIAREIATAERVPSAAVSRERFGELASASGISLVGDIRSGLLSRGDACSLLFDPVTGTQHLYQKGNPHD